MRVDLQNINQNVDTEKTAYRVPGQDNDARMAEFASGYMLDIMGSVTDNLTYEDDGLQSAQDFMQEAGRLDVTQQRNYMAVMSNSMSTEDFAKLQEEGYHPGEIAVEDLVTNLDKIKAAMAGSGTVIEGYNDDLSAEDLERITGSQAAAQEIADALTGNDLPITEDNVRNITEALSEAEQIEKITDSMLRFLVKNHVEPTIENLYKAEFSAGEDTGRGHGTYYRDADNGYVTKRADEINWDQIRDQVDKVVESAGLAGDENAGEEARWTIEAGIPLTAQNLRELHDLRQLVFPKEREELLQTVTSAIAAGRKPQQANLLTDDQRAEITHKRILEETRLQMSIEANRSLLRKGLTIDTRELERAVEQLKEAEAELFGEAMDVITQIANQPAESIQKAVFDTSSFTLLELRDIGKPIQATYEQAMKTYEAVWTAPRADLGDSISKAFRNVDDILTDLQEEINEVNRKTVRIMGYTETPVTEENFEKIQSATKAVLDVIEQMTPERTLMMIREGFNPLEENIYDLLSQLKQRPEDERAERYSEFIWKLDKSGKVTEAEKDAYIGLYRLLRQIEKNDGRPIGDVIQSDEELTLQNLLSAVRTRKATGMDLSIDDAFGTLSELKDSGTSISAQITDAFERILQTAKDAETEREYAKLLKQESMEAAKVSDAAVRTLLEAELPVSTDNLLAAQALLQSRSDLFKKLHNLRDEKKDEKQEELREKLTDFVEHLDEEGVQETYTDMMDAAGSAVTEETFEKTDALEIRELRLMYKQIHVARKMGGNEDFVFSMEIGGELTGVHLKIVRGTEEAAATVRFDSEQYGAVSARFSIHDRSVSGYVAGESAQGISELAARKEAFGRAAGYDVSSVSYLDTEKVPDDPVDNDPDQTADTRQLYSVVKAFLKNL